MAKIGIRREDKNDWERRTPLNPDQVKSLVHSGLEVAVQPSRIRVFKDDEYAIAGASLQEDLSDCDVVFAIKEIPAKFFRDSGNYMFFAHVIKGQKHNMPMLKELLAKKCTLLDYEKVTDDKNRRLIVFGNYAGLAGMLETLYTLGRRLEHQGLKTPLLALKRPLDYGSLSEAKAALEVVGRWIAEDGLPDSLNPLIVGFAGYGNVSKGAQEIFDILPHEDIAPSNLAEHIRTKKHSKHKLYKVVFYEKDMVVPAGNHKFDLQDYFQRPEKYKGVFEQYLPHLSVLMNCIYWDARYPRLITKQWLRENWTPESKLQVIGDVTCDTEGSIECTLEASEPGDPVYVYNPKTEKIEYGLTGEGLTMMAVDILPSELPRESSTFFGNQLMPYVRAIAEMDTSGGFDALKLPPEIKRCVIAYKGELTPDYKYIGKFL